VVVERLTGLEGMSTLYLAPSGDASLRCAYVIVLASGEGVVTINDYVLGEGRFRALRRAKAEELGAAAVRDLKGLGDEAFAAGERYLAFRSDRRLHSLEGLFGDAGRPLGIEALRVLAKEILRRERSAR